MTKRPPRFRALPGEPPSSHSRGATKLAPLPNAPEPEAVAAAKTSSRDERCEPKKVDRNDDPFAAAIAAAAARSPARKYPRLQTLSLLAEKHVASMHQGDFVARSRERWQHPASESDAAIANRVSRESAALVIQSAWRCSAAVRLRQRLMRRIWQQQMELAAWLSSDRRTLSHLLELTTSTRRPLVQISTELATTSCIEVPWRLDSLRGAFYRLSAMQLVLWIVFASKIHCQSRFLRRPAPAIAHAVHIPVQRTLRLMAQLRRKIVRMALLAIQCRARAYAARCRYWKMLAIHRRHRAALRVQCIYRAWVARRLVWRLRRRRAAVAIQCGWRCNRARRRVRLRRVSVCASGFLVAVMIQAVQQAATRIVDQAARHIQRVYRGRCARARFRVLVMAREQKQWHRNPSKGYALFEQGRYSLAAVYLERCFRQGIFEQDSEPMPTIEAEVSTHSQRRRRDQSPSRQPLASRQMYSISEAPSVEDSTGYSQSLRHRLALRSGGVRDQPAVQSAERLRFWEAYALSHWFAFQANGDGVHLKQAHVGFTALLREESSLGQHLSTRLHARYGLVMCSYWSGEARSQAAVARLQALCIETMDELELHGHTGTAEMVAEVSTWQQQLTMTSAALYLEEAEHEACIAQLQSLQTAGGLVDEVELLVLIAVVLLQSPVNDARPAAEVFLQRAFQAVELWPGVGFYHGHLSSTEAVAILDPAPVGAFLLHHEHMGDGEPERLLLQVKLASRVSSLRIHRRDGVYTSKKLSHFSVHGLLQQLPPAAGLDWPYGVRRPLCSSPRLERLAGAQKQQQRAVLLDWNEWQHRLSDTTLNRRRNETWSTLCLLVAVRLEAADAFAMAALVARDGLATARDRRTRADLFFAVARVSAKLQHRTDAIAAFQQAAIQGRAGPANFHAVRRAFSLAHSCDEPFDSKLERVAKLERMCVRAWSLDSCSVRLRGSPFCEALLLQRVDDEATGGDEEEDAGRVADTFFLRSLLRAHLKAFVLCEDSEMTHVHLALRCVARLAAKLTRPPPPNSLLHRRGVAPPPPPSPPFTLHRLLLAWHRLPFDLCFELAEVLYRSPSSSCESLIDMYESLYGRLRGTRPHSYTYAAYEELLLMRLAFLHLQRSSVDDDKDAEARAVECVEELIALRRMRSLDRATRVKRIQWPCAVRYPAQLSLAELAFVRGFLWERRGSTARAWRDYDELHRELLAMVQRENESSGSLRLAHKKLQGVRVFVGETADVAVGSVLHSKPFVVVQCESKHVATQHAATWMNQLSPAWHEHVEVAVASPKARLLVVVMNRSTRRRQSNGGDQVIGFVQVFVEELLIQPQRQTPQFYPIVTKDESAKRPRIKLGFQVVLAAAATTDTEAATRRRRIHGHWDVDEVQRCLHGDVQQFVQSAWIWRCFGHRWLATGEAAVAAWFLQRAVASASAVDTDHADDLVALARCYRATMGEAADSLATPLLTQAASIFRAAYEASGASDVALWKKLALVMQLTTPPSPFAEELAKKVPASSRWIAMPRRDGSSVYYFNEDTSERFDGVASQPLVSAPLEWEDTSVVTASSYDPLKPRRVVVLSAEMKTRVADHCARQSTLCASDPLQWVAMYNPRKDAMQFVNLSASVLRLETAQPAAYAMAADTSFMYHVLVAQDAFRKHYARRRWWRRLRGLVVSSFTLTVLLFTAKRRLAERADAERRQQLNCLHVVIERGAKLRAMDLLTSDPFVVLALCDGEAVVATGQTSVRHHTLNPQWHEDVRLPCSYASVDAATSLRLDVLDYDAVAAFRTTTTVEEGEGTEGGGGEGTDKKSEFMGRATVRVAPLAHGRCVTADLPLLNADGDESPRPRGHLTVTVQWVHDERTRRNAVVAPRAAAVPKPLVPPQSVHYWEQARAAYAAVVDREGELVVLGEQLARLFKRWRVAQQAGRTAEEAKLLEQRLRAALAPSQPFAIKSSAFATALAVLREALATLWGSIHSPVDEYLSSCAGDVAVAGRRRWDELSAAVAVGQSGVPPASVSIDGFVTEMEMLLDAVAAVREQRQAAIDGLTAFFASPLPSWEPPESEATVTSHVERTRQTLREAAAMTSTGGQTTAAAAVVPVQPPPQPGPTSAMARRLERLEKEKKKQIMKKKKHS